MNTYFRLILLLVLTIPAILQAQSVQDTLTVLFVGNSYIYSQNMPQIVSLISDSTSVKLITKKSTAGGATLGEHWRGERELNTRQLISDGNYDFVILQDQSMRPIEFPDSTLYYSKLFCDLIRENGGRPYFYQTWARERVPQYQEELTEVYKRAASKYDAEIIPVGEAWAKARSLRSDLELFGEDGSHPTSVGVFLTACMFVKELTGELPKNIEHEFWSYDIYGESLQLLYVDSLDAEFCRRLVESMKK